MNDAGYQSLIRNAFLRSDGLHLIEVLRRHPDVYPLVLRQSIPSISLQLFQLLFLVLVRHPLVTLKGFEDIRFFFVDSLRNLLFRL